MPESSDPQVVRTIGLGQSPPPSAPAPPAGANQTEIVDGFLNAVRLSPDRLDSARTYLDEGTIQDWDASSVTVVRSPYVVRTVDGKTNTVKMTYRAIGTLTPAGIYTPATPDGTGELDTQSATYTLRKNSQGQWRIHTPVPPGLFITEDDFTQLYSPRPLYFLDSVGVRLIPDLRYSALPEPALETYLLGQLIAGPREELRDAVGAPLTPRVASDRQLSVTLGTPTIVQIPGAAALNQQTQRQLAAQVAFTLRGSASFQSRLQIQDGARVVPIARAGDTFDYTDFAEFASVDSGLATATYIRDGAVVDSSGKPLKGPLGSGQYRLRNAVFDSDGGRTLVAGTTEPSRSTVAELLVGDTTALTNVRVPARNLTAPVWAPVGTRTDVDEVWVASGGTIYRFVPGVLGARPTPVRVIGSTSLTGKTIVSMAFSPEGARLALVIRSSDGATSQVSIAAVARTGQDVRLSGLTQVTPNGYQIADVGWRTETALIAVGPSRNSITGVFVDVAVDGSRLTASTPSGLPSAARTIAVSPDTDVQWATVTAGGEDTVWTRSLSTRSWTSPTDGGSQRGSAPTFSR